MSAPTPGPWVYVPSTEHHGPYVTTGADCTYGDICDCYAMSNPSERSVRNGGTSKPIHYQNEAADANARLIGAAPALLAALRGCLNYIENTESELGIALDSGNAARTAIALALPPATDGGGAP